MTEYLCTAARYPWLGHSISPSSLRTSQRKERDPCRTLEPYPGPPASLLISARKDWFARSIRRSADCLFWVPTIAPPVRQGRMYSPSDFVRHTQHFLTCDPRTDAGPVFTIRWSTPFSMHAARLARAPAKGPEEGHGSTDSAQGTRRPCTAIRGSTAFMQRAEPQLHIAVVWPCDLKGNLESFEVGIILGEQPGRPCREVW